MVAEPVVVTVIGDPHFKVSNVRETDAMERAIIEKLHANRTDIIVVLGDTLDRHEAIHVSPLTRAVKFLARLMSIAPVYLLIGNHDLKNNRQFLSEEHPFTALKFWGPNMSVVDTTFKVTIRGQIFTFTPYVPPGMFEKALDICPGWMDSTSIFGHQEIHGAQMGAIVSTEGDKWPLTHPFTVLGHIHDYQELQPNVIYVGTPIQHAFGDRHDKTISQFTFYSPTSRDHRRIDLELPRKQIIRLNCAEVSTYVPQANAELKIIISGTAGELKAIMKHPNIDTWKQAGYKIVYKDIPLHRAEEINPHTAVRLGPLRFSTALYQSVSSNPQLRQLFTRIFGGINQGEGLVLRIQPLQELKAPENKEPVAIIHPVTFPNLVQTQLAVPARKSLMLTKVSTQ